MTSNENILLISHRTSDVLTKLPNDSKDDQFYVIENPNKLMKYFFKSSIYSDLRNIGRFNGFSTSKSLFYDIPNFNNIPKQEQDEVMAILIKINNKLENKNIHAKTYSKPKSKSKSKSPDNKTKKFKTAGKVINRKTIKKPKIKKKKRTIKRKFWF